jgi:DNA-directed RNA polymerase specialized sigma24 family protein
MCDHLDSNERLSLENINRLMTHFAERCAPGHGEDIAQAWTVSFLRRLTGINPKRARRSFADWAADLAEDLLPQCLKNEVQGLAISYQKNYRHRGLTRDMEERQAANKAWCVSRAGDLLGLVWAARERAILGLLADGCAQKEIGKRLRVSLRNVHYLLAGIRRRAQEILGP